MKQEAEQARDDRGGLVAPVEHDIEQRCRERIREDVGVDVLADLPGGLSGADPLHDLVVAGRGEMVLQCRRVGVACGGRGGEVAHDGGVVRRRHCGQTSSAQRWACRSWPANPPT
nr:hypothetical protein [Myceligenerans indicum]